MYFNVFFNCDSFRIILIINDICYHKYEKSMILLIQEKNDSNYDDNYYDNHNHNYDYNYNKNNNFDKYNNTNNDNNKNDNYNNNN